MNPSTSRTLSFSLVLALALTACGYNTSDISPDSSRPSKGNPNAAVTVEEFADFQCPACRAAHTTIAAPMLEKYGDRITYTFRHFPIRSRHRFALDAAMAGECASDQGKFWEFVDMNFERQDEMSLEALELWGKELGLDMDLYERCWKSKIKKDTILADFKEGVDRGVTGTPAFFVNGERVQENDLKVISEAIDTALRGSGQRL